MGITSSLTVSSLKPDLQILGAYQNFIFGQSFSTQRLSNSFTPTSTVSSQTLLEFQNYLLNGFRFCHTTNSSDTTGSLSFLSFLGASPTGTTLFNITSTQVTFNIPVSGVNPTSAQQFATKSYVDSQGGSSALTLTGAVTGSGSLSSPIVTTLTQTLDEILPPQSNVSMNWNKVTNLADPVSSTDAATKNYVDALSAGFDFKSPCKAATTTNLTATYANGSSGVGATLTNSGTFATLSIDGYTPSLGDRILVKNQTLRAQNGIYAVTNVGSSSVAWILTRTGDYDMADQMTPGNYIVIESGTANNGSSWLQTSIVATVGSDPVTFMQFGYGASSFLEVSNNLSDVNNVTLARSNLSVPSIAYVDAHTWTSSAITDFSTAVLAKPLNLFATPTSSFSMGGYNLINLANPLNPQDAATKAYVDSHGGGSVTSVGLTGGTALTISGSPVTSSGIMNITLGTELQGLSLLSSNGLLVRTGSGAYSTNPYPGTTTTFLRGDGTWVSPSSSGGTVTSVGLTGSPGLTITGSPVTTSGVITATLGLELQGLSSLASNGLLVRTGTGAYSITSFPATTTKYLRDDGTWVVPPSSGVTSVSGTSGQISSSGGLTPALGLVSTAVTAGSYTNTNLTVDSYGRLTAASNGSSPLPTINNLSSSTSAYTLLLTDAVVVSNNPSSAVTLTLPGSPSIGQQYTIIDGAGVSATYPITVTSTNSRVYQTGVPSFAPSVLSTLTGFNYPFRSAITPNGNYAYIPNYNAGTVTVLQNVSSGSPTVLTTLTVGSSPISVAITPNGNYAYVVNTGSNTVTVIQNASSNSPSVLTTVTAGNNAFQIAITPNGNYAYLANRGTTTVTVLQNVSTGSPSVLTSVTVGTAPASVAITPNGNYVYVANYTSNTVSVIQNASSGSPSVLTTLTGFNNPYGIAVTPNGSYAYVTNNNGTTVMVIQNASSGSPSVLSTTLNIAAGGTDVAITPNGNYAYVTNQGSNLVYIIQNASSGSPSVFASTISVGSGAFGISITPNGNYAYVTNQGTTTVSLLQNVSGIASAVIASNYGQINLLYNGTAWDATAPGMTSITAGTGLLGGTITSSGTIALASTSVTAGTYSNPGSVAVNAQGQLTSISAGQGALNGIAVFSTAGSSSWTVPTGVTKIKATVVGGGGGGGSSYISGSSGYAGAGGGGGGSAKAILTVNSGQVLNLTVGSGGSGGTSGTGGSGTASSLSGTGITTITGNGGTGGSYNSFGTGGSASGGNFNIQGQNGGYWSYSSNINTAFSLSGAGGFSIFPGGNSVSAAQPGAAGQYGGGGSGTGLPNGTVYTGGAGGSGIIIIEW